jgi:hypothetical protein
MKISPIFVCLVAEQLMCATYIDPILPKKKHVFYVFTYRYFPNTSTTPLQEGIVPNPDGCLITFALAHDRNVSMQCSRPYHVSFAPPNGVPSTFRK